MMTLGFDWDDGNIHKNEIKHALVQAEIESVFFVNPIIKNDKRHSEEEDRFIAFGITATGKLLHVSFTMRVVNYKMNIRPISARPLSKKERHEYEKALSKI